MNNRAAAGAARPATVAIAPLASSRKESLQALDADHLKPGELWYHAMDEAAGGLRSLRRRPTGHHGPDTSHTHRLIHKAPKHPGITVELKAMVGGFIAFTDKAEWAAIARTSHAPQDACDDFLATHQLGSLLQFSDNVP